MDFNKFIQDKGLKNTTITQYKRNFKIIKTLLGENPLDLDLDFINRFRTFRNELHKLNYADTSIRSILITWKSIMDWLPECMVFKRTREDVNATLLEYDGKLKAKREKNEPDTDMTTMEELRGVLDRIEKFHEETPFKQTYLDLVIVALYTLMPPIRLDYADMVLLRQPPNCDESCFNYAVVTDDLFYFVLCDYKTDKRYGRYESPRYAHDTRLYKIVRTWADTYHKEGGLLEMMTRNDLGKRIKKIFETYLDKCITMNTIRRTFETELIQSDDYKQMTLEEKREKHRQLLHSFETAQEYNIVITE